MAPIYTIPQYLLDRTQIHDTVTRMLYQVDTRAFSALSTHVFTRTLTTDYTAMFGGEPSVGPSSNTIGSWEGIMGSKDVTQHVVTGLLIDLAQPQGSEGEAEAVGEEEEEEVSIPSTAKVSANVLVNIIKKGAEGGERTNNGGRYELEMQRLGRGEVKALTGRGNGNPWRVSLLRAVPLWQAGNTAILGASF